MLQPFDNILNSYLYALKKMVEITGGTVVVDWLNGLVCLCALFISIICFKSKYKLKIQSDESVFNQTLVWLILAVGIVFFLLGKCCGEFDLVRRYMV